MKNSQRGFALPIIIAIVAILAIGGGSLVYVSKDEARQEEVKKIEVKKDYTLTTSTSTPVALVIPNSSTSTKVKPVNKNTTTNLVGAKVTLTVNGKGARDNIQVLEKGAPVKVQWISSGTDKCNIYAKLQPQNRQVLFVEPQNKTAVPYQTSNSQGFIETLADEDYRNNNTWENPQWLVFYSDCYRASNSSVAVSDIVSVQVVPTGTKNNLVINEPTKTVFTTGESVTIKWSSDTSNVPTVDISLNDRTDSYTVVQIANSIKNKGFYNWVVPNITPGFYKIAVSEPTGGAEKAYDETGLIEFKQGSSGVIINQNIQAEVNKNNEFSTSTLSRQLKIKANLSSLRASAELVYDNNGGSYGQLAFNLGSCSGKSGTLFADSYVFKNLVGATEDSLSKGTCVSVGSPGKVNSFAVSVPLPEMSGYNWCVDSQGNSKQIVGKITSDSCD